MFPRRQNPTENKLLQKILMHCEREGISVRFRDAPKLGPKKLPMRGYFNGVEIVVAKRHRDWFLVLIHEYCHLKQQLRGARWFSDPIYDRMWSTYDRWLLHKSNPSMDRVRICAREIALCELDCERMVVDYARRLDLPCIDIPKYIRAANTYVFSFEAARQLRKWPTYRSPYHILELQALVPARFVRQDRITHLPPGFLELFARYCVR